LAENKNRIKTGIDSQKGEMLPSFAAIRRSKMHRKQSPLVIHLIAAHPLASRQLKRLLGKGSSFSVELAPGPDFDTSLPSNVFMGNEKLTSREMTVLALLRRGLRNSEIAPRLGIKRSTVKTHVSTILSKMGVSNRRELADDR
jgi:DNA-binding CsgD family transcriptional regulator